MKVTESVGDLRTRAALRTSLTASEAINYGLFLPAQGSKKGKFLANERPIADYPALYRNKKNTPVDNTQSNSPDSGLGQEICWLEYQITIAGKDKEDCNCHFWHISRHQSVIPNPWWCTTLGLRVSLKVERHDGVPLAIDERSPMKGRFLDHS
ncbi:unnamed protein product [Dibothriocephalus latus]|uniref:Uncharacterized protein n=1 Tax=Dibothriocephalus latus TaxID=60516 RepID=A0A3P7NSU6_DIBLA|nr:unnamed protein product [Dibothriocephalus latus]